MRYLTILALFGFALSLRAGDDRTTQYTVVVTGIVCQSCRDIVVTAMKKLPGVREVDFAKGDAEGSSKLSFKSSSDTLTKNDAELTLGDHVKEFAILSLDKSK